MVPSDHRPQLTRRSLLRGAAVTAGAAGAAAGLPLGVVGSSAAGSSVASSFERAAAARPNVLWIITDDQTRRMLKLMPRTMDRLVRRGTNFVNGYAEVPWCGPSRASMLSGMYVHNHHCKSNNTHRKFVGHGLDRDTVGTRMKDAGYTNGYFGKYMNGQGIDPGYIAPGWNRWVTYMDDVDEVNVDGDVRRNRMQRGVAPDLLAAHHCDEFIRSHATKPWFTIFAPTSPHDPYQPSRKHRHSFDKVVWDPPAFNERDLSDKPAFLRNLPRRDHERMRHIYEGKLEELQDLDDQINGLLQTLVDTNQLHRTVIMLVSDNGYLLGEHRLFKKEQPYEESAGVPFVISGPGIPRGTSSAFVSTADLMPTTLALAGLDPDAGRVLDGRSMVRGLHAGDWGGWRRRIFTENPNLGWAMVREGRHVFVDRYRQGGSELYDLKSDPYQMRSIARKSDTSRYEATTKAFRTASGLSLRALET